MKALSVGRVTSGILYEAAFAAALVAWMSVVGLCIFFLAP